jgi:hypothetical protein
MCPRPVVIKRIKGEYSAQMRFVKDQDVIQAIAPERADQPLDIRVLPGRPWRNRPVPNAHRPHASSKDWSIGRVIVAHHIGRRCVPRAGLHDAAPATPLSDVASPRTT